MAISKKSMVKSALENGRKVSGASAWRDFGLYRLSSAIHKLREEGLNIETVMVDRDGETFAEYRLANG